LGSEVIQIAGDPFLPLKLAYIKLPPSATKYEVLKRIYDW
jgi:hypothetical protein